MMRNLIVERFQMKAHRETRELSIYALVVDKNGTKLKASADAAGEENTIATVKKDEGKDGFPVLAPGAPGLVVETRNGRGRITAFHADVHMLAEFLSSQLGRAVFDQTGINGTFDFALYFRPENAAADDTNPQPTIFDALREQLGLRLDARKGPVEMLVIEHIEKVPVGN
jgi:uncharacterized protein (TIGR03435 family)